MKLDHIRNFCIIAHIDHGKSTLADRLMELTGTVKERDMKHQLLDKMDLEREKGITIKLAPVKMNYLDYELNLIDTPGHVDFSYEVSRSLMACEGAILVVDASQGIQAQTLSNVYLAIEAGLVIVPVINKIDLPAANIDKVSLEIINLLGCKRSDIIPISAKTAQNVEQVLQKIVETIPCPELSTLPTRALIFDSYFDEYRGVILYVRIKDGSLHNKDQVLLMSSSLGFQILEIGYLTPEMTAVDRLGQGEIGYIVSNLKSAKQAHVGDTVTLASAPAQEPLPGYKQILPFVYAGFYPESSDDYETLKLSVEKLALSDSSLTYSYENSPVLGFGIRIGFLGLLHLEIIKERLEREYGLNLIVTNPSTDYKIVLNDANQTEISINSATELPDITKVKEILEPWIKGEMVLPDIYIGPIIQLIALKRGLYKDLSYIDNQGVIKFEAPLANLLTDFYDQLKSLTSGYGSFNYEISNYRPADLVKLDFIIAGERLDALSVIVHRLEAVNLAKVTLLKLKDIIPRQNFKVALQAAINGHIIAREDISAYRKDVTKGLYGGDSSRKKKVLEKQKKGKKRLKKFGNIDLPNETFFVMMKKD